MPAFAVAVVLVAVTVMYAPPAKACDCMGPGLSLVAPAAGSTGVPLNTRIWLGTSEAHHVASVRLVVEESSTAIGFTQTTIESLGVPHVFVLTPEDDLAPSTSYAVLVGDEALTTFTTGTETDVTPPAPPELEVQQTTGGGPIDIFWCGGFTQGDSFVSLGIPHDGLLAVVDRDESSELDVDRLSGAITGITPRDSLTLGSGGKCAVGWDEAGPFASATFRAGAFDLAGNFSGFGPERSVTLPPPYCSCDAAEQPGPAPSTGGLVALLLALAVVARPRVQA